VETDPVADTQGKVLGGGGQIPKTNLLLEIANNKIERERQEINRAFKFPTTVPIIFMVLSPYKIFLRS
jgi:hypothetical protein